MKAAQMLFNKGLQCNAPDTVTVSDPEYDDATLDFSEDGQVTITQTDEGGRLHTVILSVDQIAQIYAQRLKWKPANNS